MISIRMNLDSHTPQYSWVKPTLEKLNAVFVERSREVRLEIKELDDLLELCKVLESNSIMARCWLEIHNNVLEINEYEDG